MTNHIGYYIKPKAKAAKPVSRKRSKTKVRAPKVEAAQPINKEEGQIES